MRLFVAVEIEPAVADTIAVCARELQQTAAAAAPRARIAWVGPGQWHVTVRFVGEIPGERVDDILRALAPPIPVASFEVEVAGVGAFPPRGAPRVFWAGIVRGGGGLEAVEGEISRRLATRGIPSEERPYRPHVTLARVRDAAGLRSRPLLEGAAERRFGAWQVGAITLFESRPTARGHEYVPLQRTQLQAP